MRYYRPFSFIGTGCRSLYSILYSDGQKKRKSLKIVYDLEKYLKWNSENLKKNCQNPEIFRILTLFQLSKNLQVSTLTSDEKCRHFCRLGTLAQICTATDGNKFGTSYGL
jgi:hypothetical protein